MIDGTTREAVSDLRDVIWRLWKDSANGWFTYLDENGALVSELDAYRDDWADQQRWTAQIEARARDFEDEDDCPGCIGRGTGGRCCICGRPIPTHLRRKPGDPSELDDNVRYWPVGVA